MQQAIQPAIKQPCKIGGWQFDPSDGRLKSVDKSVKLQPRISLLLALFIANANELLTREQLTDILWKDRIVNEDALSRCIAELRSALGDDRQNPTFIETIPKKGYRFIYPLNDPIKKYKIPLFTAIPVIIIIVSLLFFNESSIPQYDGVLHKGLISAERLTTDALLEHTPEISPDGKMTAFTSQSNNRLVVKIVDNEGKVLDIIVDDIDSMMSPTFSADSKSLTVAVMSRVAPCTIYHYDLLTKNRLKIGDWQFDPTDGRLKSVDKSVKLQPRLSLLLALFIANVNELLTREQLTEILWKDRIVNEDALSRCIAELRSALGDDRQNPTFIETIPKKGYRFIYLLNDPIKKYKIPLFSAIPVIIVIVSLLLFNGSSIPQYDGALQKGLISAKRLTTDGLLEYTPEISPDGKMTAFTSRSNKRLVVKIVDNDGKLLHTIADDIDSMMSPSFSADSKSLTLAAVSKVVPCTIFHYDLLTKNRLNIGECLLPNRSGIFSWSSDSKFLAFIAKDPISKIAAVWLYDRVQQTKIQLTAPHNSGYFDTRPRFSPNNKKLAFTRGSQSVRNLVSLDLKNPNKVFQLTDHRNYISSFSWLKDNKHLLFDSDKRGDRNLWIINSQTKKETLLGARDAQFPSLSQDNSILTFLDVRYKANIWSVNLSNKKDQLLPLTRSIKYNNMPSFSPDGSQFAFTSNRQGKGAIWLYSLTTNKQRKLFSLDGENLILPNWSPAGDKLLVSYKNSSEYGCYQYDIKNQHYESVGKFEKEYYSCLYGSKGDIFAMTKEENQVSQIIKITGNKTIEQMTNDGVNQMMLLNENVLIYSSKNRNGLQMMSLSGEKLASVLPDFSMNFHEHWTAHDGTIYYPKFKGKRGIWRYNVNSAEDTFVSEHLPSAIGNTLAISPDQSMLLICRTDSVDSDVFISTLTYE
jgi:DNA-binding winged helix-turn-helix (wHTH) protein